MTDVQLYENVLYEINKAEVPTLLLGGYNHLFNKGQYQYFNKRYDKFEQTQLLTDELQSIKVDGVLTGPFNPGNDDNLVTNLPDDYWHILKVKTVVTFTSQVDCYAANQTLKENAKRLTSDTDGFIQGNSYMEPKYYRPYYSIFNRNDGNTPIISLKLGEDFNNVGTLTSVIIDYLRLPAPINITQAKLDDPGLAVTLPYPEDVALSVLREIVMLVHENASDPRTSSAYQVSMSKLSDR